MEINSFSGSYRWLSNFYPSYVQYEDVIYPTVEHGFQAAKSLDHNVRQWIKKSETPGEAKRRGRTVILRVSWDMIKEEVMLGLLRDKFTIPTLRDNLINTADARLVEGNTWGDIYWGVCRGVGRNRLGELLMQVRREITDGRFERPFPL